MLHSGSSMPIGPFVRKCLGPLERPVSNLYRGIFFNLDRFVAKVRQWAPATRILEVGCGEGAVLERLCRVYPDAQLAGIDITPHIGRQFRGDRLRVTFHQEALETFSFNHVERFDLVLLCDVMHHVPWNQHEVLLRQTHLTLKPGGLLVLKDWEKRSNFIHPVCHFAEHYLTGDRTRYGTEQSFRDLIYRVFGPSSIKALERFSPWPNNLAFLIRV
jgi:2-polyprenyl-3-methyl-5-hydroxy-6-metoxy-1,4-benzoquinol methylase